MNEPQIEKNYTFKVVTTVPTENTVVEVSKVKAVSESEAKAKVLALYKDESSVNVNEISRRMSPWPAITFLAIADFCTIFLYYGQTCFGFLSIFPSPMSWICSYVLYIGLLLKNKCFFDLIKTPYDVVITLLITWLMGAFIEILNGSAVQMPGCVSGFFNSIGLSDNSKIVLTGILLSYLGVRWVAGVVWLLLIALGLIEISNASEYMTKLQSAIFLVSAFFGIIFFIKYEGEILFTSAWKFGKSFIKRVKGDVGSISKNGGNHD